MTENEIGTIAVDIAYTIHKILGPGLLESVYESAFAYELTERNIPFTRQTEIPVKYKNAILDKSFRTDIIIDNKVIIELKSIETIEKIHHKTILNYMKITDIKLSFLINFNVEYIKNGIFRKVNGL
ncbi:MAG TPA: GxxExxY protein [Chitinophagaceae bacterium]|jgi:GxxExxY protein|nr:GxxExxY protein [Chitinophagaceae bacterium]HRG92119.1 GxxExxY protein [Chitinophagaceae bacterium]